MFQVAGGGSHPVALKKIESQCHTRIHHLFSLSVIASLVAVFLWVFIVYFNILGNLVVLGRKLLMGWSLVWPSCIFLIGGRRNPLIYGPEISWQPCQDGSNICERDRQTGGGGCGERMCCVRTESVETVMGNKLKAHILQRWAAGRSRSWKQHRSLLISNGSCNCGVYHVAGFSWSSEPKSVARDCKTEKGTKWDPNFPGGCSSKHTSSMLFQVNRNSNGNTKIIIVRW